MENGNKTENMKLTLVIRTGAGDMGRSLNHVSRAQSAPIQANPRMESAFF